MSVTVPLYGFGGGSSPLNFEVKAYTTEKALLADTPKENTVGVITETGITSWYFSESKPATPTEGQLWIEVGDSSASPGKFGALKKNHLAVYPLRAYQYLSAKWTKVTAKTYKNGAWVSWGLILYAPGNTCDDVTGGWSDEGYAYDSDSPAGGGTVASTYLQAKYGSSYEGCIGTSNKIDLTNYNTLYVDGYTTKAASTSDVFVSSNKKYILDTLAARGDLPTTRKTIAIDISSLTGKYAISFGASYSGAATSRVYNIWLE